MKINWGTAIILAFAAFIGFILYFVIQMNSNTNNHDLVTTNYYKQELAHQQHIDKQNNTRKAKRQPIVTPTKNGINVYFKGDSKTRITGVITLYRPSDKKLDIKLPFTTDSLHVFIAEKHLVSGRWDISIDFTQENKNYMYQEKIIF